MWAILSNSSDSESGLPGLAITIRFAVQKGFLSASSAGVTVSFRRQWREMDSFHYAGF
jgi:hypothetical protein